MRCKQTSPAQIGFSLLENPRATSILTPPNARTVDIETTRTTTATSALPRSTMQSRLANPQAVGVGDVEEGGEGMEAAKVGETPTLRMPTPMPAILPHTVRYSADSLSVHLIHQIEIDVVAVAIENPKIAFLPALLSVSKRLSTTPSHEWAAAGSKIMVPRTICNTTSRYSPLTIVSDIDYSSGGLEVD